MGKTVFKARVQNFKSFVNTAIMDLIFKKKRSYLNFLNEIL